MSLDPLDELRKLQIDVEPATRGRHVAAIEDAVAHRPRQQPRRRWLLGVVTAGLIAGPVAAVAAEGSVPGDFLYPIKLTIEPIRELFDTDVVASHRITELDVLIDADAESDLIDRHIDATRDALDEVEAPRLEQDFERLIDRIDTDRAVTDVPPTDQPTDTAPITDEATDVDRPTDRDRPVGSTVVTEPTDRTDPPASTSPTTHPASDETTSTTEAVTDGTGGDSDRPRDDQP